MYINKQILQFRISLLGTTPEIWRRIQVPRKYSFWDLHVAIQDAMGWLDYHLHMFRLSRPYGKKTDLIGVPVDDEFLNDQNILPGWEVPISNYLTEPGMTIQYEYDFGDSWIHEILLESIQIKEKRVKYPKCIAGERACPPEDCGGIPGFEDLLEILKDSKNEEYKDTMEWLVGSYIPEYFEPSKVKFDNPAKRFDIAFSE
jgi:Plasmid pRiA4b ORF-3-like protein